MVKLDRHTLQEEPSGVWLRRVPVAAGALVAGVGLMVLIGWVFGLDSLKCVMPGLATMKSNTALCFLFLGLALARREKRALRLACAGIVCAVAGLTLAEYLSGEDLGLDQLLFRDTLDRHTVYPGRMVQATALGFLLCGASLLLLEAGSRSARRAQQVLAVCVGVIGVVAMLGYAYNAQQLYHFAGYSSMALHTAVSFVVLALGLFLARPDGLARMLSAPGPTALMMRRLLPMTILVPAVTGWLVDRGLELGFYRQGMDLAVMALAMMFSLAALVWWTAAALNRADAIRKQAEESLRSSALFPEENPFPILRVSRDGTVLYANRAAAPQLAQWQCHVEGEAPEFMCQVLLAALDLGMIRELETRCGERLFSFMLIPILDRDYVNLYGRDITERKQAEEALKASLHEKEVLLKEIHHRVKNNLQVISSLVSLQADNLADERIRDELNDVRDRIRSMALIHEKLYQTSDLAQLDFAEYAASMTQALWRSHSVLAKNVRFHLAVEPVALSIETAVPCGLILNELAGNSLKHAFPNNSGGEVEVGFDIDPATKTVCLRVRDNGVGLPAGFDWRQSQSLGLRLVTILAGQLRGTVETATGPGTEFKIIFPLKENEQ